MADSETVAELTAKAGDDEWIRYYFQGPLAFGTAGLRGTMNAGTFAMNRYTVAQATQGLADLINREEGNADRGVLIGFDSRNNSPEFARITASVLAANGIKVFLYDELRPTPMVSFGLRYLNCIAGVNITASHNPKEYNGYKVYWEDGAQISLEQAIVVSDSINATDIFEGVKTCDYDAAVAEGKITVVGPELDEEYLKNVMAQQVDPKAIERTADELKVVYTPFHGAGYRLVPEVLKRAGLKYLYPVPEQATPDGDFPTVKSPNPENPEGFTLGIALAEKIESDLIVGTDPDADRVGVMARGKDGKFVTITGNQMGALLLDYILTAHTENGTMPPEPFAVKTIVTTELAAAICEKFGVKLHNVLTGFKFIGEVIYQSEVSGHGSYILGFEESYGYLKGTYARDKDAVVATLLIIEMASYYRKKGMTLIDALESVFARYGFYVEKTVNVTMAGLDGTERMAALMAKLRAEAPKSVGGLEVVAIRDYKEGTVTAKDGSVTPTGLPKSNVLCFDLAGGNTVVVRPSGTEPKIKFYLLCRGENEAQAKEILAACEKESASWQ
ncbi:MAG: phospho-sugar mutase [Ruminococcaceae bacterium]|nr:phospho-sugar mutase [Oscillospiraceae bacterium]